MKNPYLILLFSGLLTFVANAKDQHPIDSLRSVIATAEYDTAICNAYLSWGEEVYLSNPDTALILWQIAHDLADHNLVAHLPNPL